VLLLEMVTEEGKLHLNVAVRAREVLPQLIISWIVLRKIWISASEKKKNSESSQLHFFTTAL
jgi:hypothetical protein